MKFKVRDGLLFYYNTKRTESPEVVSCYLADKIAEANDLVYAERLVRKYDGKIITVDDETYKIKEGEENAKESNS